MQAFRITHIYSGGEIPLLDSTGIVFGLIIPPPDPCLAQSLYEEAKKVAQGETSVMEHRRGKFNAYSVGFSYGGVQVVSSSLSLR